MNFYPHHIGDYKSATAHLSNEEDLAYRRLLEMYYDTEQPIPVDTQWVSRRLRVATEAVEVVLKDFFLCSETGYTHVRCDKEITEYNRKADIARTNGRNGGRRKSLSDKEKNPAGSNPVPNGNPGLTKPLANHEPVTNNQEPIVKSKRVTAPSIPKPDDVDQQTWDDWKQLRRTKKAPITQTVLTGARIEADKAGIQLEAFLQVWCRRGSQGLEASWLKPEERKPSRKHSGFSEMNYREGVSEDGSLT